MTANVMLIAGECARTRLLQEALGQAGYGVQRKEEPVPVEGVDLLILAIEADPDHLIELSRETDGLRQTPMLVWLGQEGEVTAALQRGADDCAARIADLPEVLARVSALLRRSQREPGSTILSFGRVQVDLRRGSADIGSGAVALTPKELGLFRYLASRAGAIIARDELLREVWGYAISATRTVDTHMAALRRKLESNPRRPEHLFTVRGRGYQFRR